MTTTTAAAIYCRVSTATQGERGYSLEAQAEDCKKLAADLGAVVVAQFTDIESGADWDLPGLNRMLDAAARHEFSMVLVYDPDRLARGMGKQLAVEAELSRSGVALRYVTVKLGDTAEDRLLKNVRASVAEYEREKIAIRTTRGRRAKAERGLVVGSGVPPYGYRYVYTGEGRERKVSGLEPDPVTAPVVQRIIKDLATTPTTKLAAQLTAEGVPTYLGGKAWASSTLLEMLKNPVYTGIAAYGRRDAKKQPRDSNQWLNIAVPPLVDAEAVEAARYGLRRRKVGREARSEKMATPYPLRGMLTCGHCGGAMAAVPCNGYHYYYCLRAQPHRAALQGKDLCTLPGVPAAPLNAYAWELVGHVLLNPENLREGLAAEVEAHENTHARRRGRLETLDKEIATLRRRMERITVERLDVEPGSEGERALKAVAEGTEKALARLLADRAELAALPSTGLSAEDAASLEQFAAAIRPGIDNATPQDQRHIYSMLRLQGRVVKDPEGVKLGRRHHFTIEWTGVITLSDTSKEQKKTRVSYFSPEVEQWEAEHLAKAAV